MRIFDIMTRAVVSVHVDDTLGRIRQIFEESSFHHVLVTRQGKLVGVISDRDLLKHLSPFLGSKWMERTQDRNILSRKAHQIMKRRLVLRA